MIRTNVHVSYHQMVVAEEGGEPPSSAPNGLTASAPGGAVILTGIHTGVVDVTVELADAEPPLRDEPWDKVEETELITVKGEVRLNGLMGDFLEVLPNLTPQGPGKYGLRVYARGRDIDPCAVPDVPFEFYLVVMWPIDVGPEVARRYGAGVAEELGLPDKSAEIRKWAREHAQPANEPGRRVTSIVREGGSPVVALPLPARGIAGARDHRLLIRNPYAPAPPPSQPGRLVAAAPDCVAISTLKARGNVGIWLNWRNDPPKPNSRWAESEEIEFVTTSGVMRLENLTLHDAEDAAHLTPQGAGRYRLRVHGRSFGSNPNAPKEAYLLVVWPVQLGAP